MHRMLVASFLLISLCHTVHFQREQLFAQALVHPFVFYPQYIPSYNGWIDVLLEYHLLAWGDLLYDLLQLQGELVRQRECGGHLGYFNALVLVILS